MIPVLVILARRFGAPFTPLFRVHRSGVRPRQQPPGSVCATGLLTAGTPAYAASVGLAVGSLATPQGSVATLIASQLAGSAAPPLQVRRFAPLAAAGVLAATLVLWANP